MNYITNKNGEIETIRHGELNLLPIVKKPAGLKETSKVLNIGSHGHPHGVVNGTFYVKNGGENVIGYLVAKDGCYLTHEEHGDIEGGGNLKKAMIDTGVYEVRNQVEDGHEGMKQVID